MRMLTLGVLVRTVHVVASDDDAGKLVRLLVRLDVHLSSCLAGGVRVGGFQQAVLFQIVAIMLAIDLVRADVDKLLDAALDSRFQELVGAHNVGLCEGEGVTERQIDVRHGCKVHDGVNIVLSDAAQHRSLIIDVTKDEGEVR